MREAPQGHRDTSRIHNNVYSETGKNGVSWRYEEQAMDARYVKYYHFHLREQAPFARRCITRRIFPFPVSTCGHESRSIPPARASSRICLPGWFWRRSVDRAWAKGGLPSCCVTMGNGVSSGNNSRLICWRFCVYTLHRAACPVCVYLLQKCPLLAVLCLTLTLALQWAYKRK